MLLCLDVKDTPPTPTTKVCEKEEEKEEEVWQDIADALSNWSRRILDCVSRHRATSENFRETVEESLWRQQLDGFITGHDLTELRYVADVWTNLLNAIFCYTLGCVFVKREITYLLELYSLRQITNSLFIETCLIL